MMATGPVPATQKALHYAGLRVQDMDFWEINEAFSVVVLNAATQLGIDVNEINVNGGALAIGHPLGVNRHPFFGTLARTLQLQDKQRGCASACVGGGQGIAMVIETC